MANCEFTLSMLANIGLSAGIDLGFNACEATSWNDPTTFERRLSLRFGDRKHVGPHSRLNDYARAWDETASCIREPRIIEIPVALLQRSIDEGRRHITAALLELIPSGPSGVKDMDWTFA